MCYQGRQIANEAAVFVSRSGFVTNLRLRHDLYNRSTAHQWGYVGAGPSQLAFDILMDMFGDEAFAKRYYSKFDHELAFKTPHQGEWDLSAADILLMIASINQKEGWGPLESSN